ncbi:MAG: DUF5596 domain-containing protein [Clostridia bacterium]|nr:DUF5596 domain-containing protein [Clostridia bacterium]
MMVMIANLIHELDFPEEAIASLKRDHKAMAALPGGEERLKEAARNMLTAEGISFHETAKALSAQSGVHLYTVELMVQLYAAIPLRKIYQEKGYSDVLYLDTMKDIPCKMMECHGVHGIWGTIASDWQQGFFRCKRFSLGRLQYEEFPLPIENYKSYKKGDIVYNCHIPSGGSMPMKAVMESFKKAYAFYRSQLKDGILPVHLHSWLIYPGHYEVYSEGSNLRKFYDLFDVLEPVEKPENPYLWRVFGVETCEDYTALPEKTSLQRRFKEYLLSGKCMGSARGMLLFDGEKILPH